jgi:hypothetical protein
MSQYIQFVPLWLQTRRSLIMSEIDEAIYTIYFEIFKLCKYKTTLSACYRKLLYLHYLLPPFHDEA